MISRLRAIKGMTLLEVSIALFILAISLLGLAGLQLVALRGDHMGQQATLATALAKDKLAELRAADQLNDGEDQYIDKANGVTYARQWTVQPEGAQSATTIVRVQVLWRGSMADRAVTVSATISQT